MLSKLKEIRDKKMKSEQKIKAVRSQIMEDKLRKGASREMYSEIYKPITSEISRQEESLSSQLKSQLKALKALPDIKEQLALLPRDFVNKIQEAESEKEALGPTEPLVPLPKTLAIPILKPEEDIPEEDIYKLFEDYEKERPKGSKESPIVDLDAKIDSKVLEEYEYYNPSEMYNFYNADESNPDKINRETFEGTIHDVNKGIQSLNGLITSKSKSKDTQKQEEASQLKYKQGELIKYRDRLKYILAMDSTYGKGLRMKAKGTVGSAGLKGTFGSVGSLDPKGTVKNQYKVSPDGQYGNLSINLNKLYSQNKLIAKDSTTGKEVMNMKVDDDLIDLIDKRYNSNKTHSILSRQIFNELTEKSGLPVNKRSMKFQNIIRGKGYGICPCNPEDLINDLELICGSIDAGNNNQDLINKGISIIDKLLKMNEISPDQHQLLYKKYFM